MDAQESSPQQWLSQIGAQRLFEALEELRPDAAMFVVNEDRQVLHWSPQAEAMLGYQEDDVLGQHCRMISRCQECMIGCPIADSPTAIAQVSTLYTQEGTPLTLRRLGAALRDEQGRFLGGVEYLFSPQDTPEAPEESPSQDDAQAASVGPLTDDDQGFFAPMTAPELLPFLAAPDSSAGATEAAPEEGTEQDDTAESALAYDREQLEDNDFMRLGDLVTRDAGMKKMLSTLHRIAESDASVLLQGESGTGKELVARAVHLNSQRKDGPFVAVNCAALTPTLLESELFGHEKGAFTGAVMKRIGLFQRAEGGTIFLDEIAELPLDLQSKLLRVLEEREVVPVGKDSPIKINIRVISASYKSLTKLVEAGEFREDLMYRLRVVPLKLPPLRKRPQDLELLTWHFINLFNASGTRYITHITKAALQRLQQHHWPGNVRELRNAIEYAFAVGRGHVLHKAELPLEPEADPDAETQPPAWLTHPPPVAAVRGTASPAPDDAPASPEEQEKQAIIDALQSTHGHLGQAADQLGISRPTLWRKRKKYGI